MTKQRSNRVGQQENVTGPPSSPAPWLDVDASSLVAELQHLLTAQATEMAAMRVYIGQLHQALEMMTKDAMIRTETEDSANGAVVPAG